MVSAQGNGNGEGGGGEDEIPASFYPFGDDAGDSEVEKNDDGSSPAIDLDPNEIPFYGKKYTKIYVRQTVD